MTEDTESPSFYGSGVAECEFIYEDESYTACLTAQDWDQKEPLT